ncbi:MAG: homocysteine biosynthesis protein [Candidatus Bathyarchaeia archaeon]
MTAEEMIEIVENKGARVASKEIDVVTTGTFGAMCSSGAFLNFGHSDPPIKMEKVTLNGVEAYHGNAAVDCYIGATKMHPERMFEYGGGHVIEDLVSGKAIEVEATAYGTDCYPRKHIETEITIHDLNQAILCNPRNGYQRYNTAVNGRGDVIYTYMGKLLPDYGNATYSGAGALSPLNNDPDYETIGIGTRIFLGGGVGYIIGEGTQHEPANRLGTIMVKGDLKQMTPEYLKGASFTKYGTSLYVGIGIPIPILNEGLALKTGIKDEQITSSVVDYGVPRRQRPILKETTYAELKSGMLTINNREIPVAALSSLRVARKIAEELKNWIQDGRFLLTEPVERLPTNTVFKPMKPSRETLYAKAVMTPAATCRPDEGIEEVARRIVQKEVNHIVVVNDQEELEGIVTSFDVTKAVATGEKNLANIMTRRVVTTVPDEPIEACVQKLKRYDISALPVIDARNKVLGIVTSEAISRFLGGKVG